MDRIFVICDIAGLSLNLRNDHNRYSLLVLKPIQIMPAAIHRNKQEFLYMQVANMIVDLQQSNVLRPGDQLPSLRSLSEKLSVSVPTVQQAYGELERQGLIQAKPKSGYFLSPAVHRVAQPKRSALATRPTKVNRQSLIERVFDAIQQPNVVPLGIANPSACYSSEKKLARVMKQVAAKAGAKAISYGPMYGYHPLRRQLALRYLDLGVKVESDDLLITNGAQEALAIALQCVAKPGDVIAVESPAYFGMLELIESLGMMAFEIPLCPEDGVWLEGLSTAIAEHPIKACIFSSSISNPLGSRMSDQRLQAIVELLEANNIPLIEDDVYGELDFSPRRLRPGQFYSTKGLVLSCSSFSKTVAPGYRIGWLLAGRFADHARRLKRALSCSSPLLSQWTLAEFIASGDYDRSVRRLRHALLRNKDRMIEQIQRHFPANTKVSNPSGGGVLWVELPPGNDSEVLFTKALAQGISIAPGKLFSPTNKYRRCIRLSYGVVWSDEIEDAIAQLGRCVHE